jgi:hypothetical protein
MMVVVVVVVVNCVEHFKRDYYMLHLTETKLIRHVGAKCAY